MRVRAVAWRAAAVDRDPDPTRRCSAPCGHAGDAFANLDPAHPLDNLCLDLVEDEGHWFGAWLSAADKHALKEFLKTQ